MNKVFILCDGKGKFLGCFINRNFAIQSWMLSHSKTGREFRFVEENIFEGRKIVGTIKVIEVLNRVEHL